MRSALRYSSVLKATPYSVVFGRNPPTTVTQLCQEFEDEMNGLLQDQAVLAEASKSLQPAADTSHVTSQDTMSITSESSDNEVVVKPAASHVMDPCWLSTEAFVAYCGEYMSSRGSEDLIIFPPSIYQYITAPPNVDETYRFRRTDEAIAKFLGECNRLFETSLICFMQSII